MEKNLLQIITFSAFLTGLTPLIELKCVSNSTIRTKMSDILRLQIIDYLQETDSELKVAPNLELPELVDVLIDKANDAELEYAILSYAYSNTVPVENFEAFHAEVIKGLESLAEGQEAADDFMDTIAEKYL
jgi:hypothetical protein